MTEDPRPLILHVLHHLVVGGMENGLVNLINHMPEERYRHAILCIEDFSDFRQRLRRPDVPLVPLYRSRIGIWRLRRQIFGWCRKLRPQIVHTRGTSGLDALLPARLAGVPCLVHGEHGWDVDNLDGRQWKPAALRRLHSVMVDRYVAVSKDLQSYLQQRIGIDAARVTQIYNGVDTARFRPAESTDATIPGCPFDRRVHWLVGSVGRMQAVKNPLALARAFARALELQPGLRERLRLVMVGDGPLRAQLQAQLDAAGVGPLAWLPGARDDVADVMRGLDCFVLPSLAEGVSNTILEAMASGLPVIATRVGGNTELVLHGQTGELVPPADLEAMVASLVGLAGDSQRAARLGRAGRLEVERKFGLQAMIDAYVELYDGQKKG